MDSVMKRGDRFIPWYFVLFFIVIAMVDATMITIAVKTKTGTMTGNAYQQGLDYDQILEKVAAQKALGWKGTVDLSDEGYLHFYLTDRAGKPLSNAVVKAHIIRPVHEGNDFNVDLQPDGQGGFGTKISFPFPGLWDVNIEAAWQNHHYYLMKTVTARR